MKGKIKISSIPKFLPKGWSVKLKEGKLILSHKEHGEFGVVEIDKLIEKGIFKVDKRFEPILKSIAKGEVHVEEEKVISPYLIAGLIGLSVLGVSIFLLRGRR